VSQESQEQAIGTPADVELEDALDSVGATESVHTTEDVEPDAGDASGDDLTADDAAALLAGDAPVEPEPAEPEDVDPVEQYRAELRRQPGD